MTTAPASNHTATHPPGATLHLGGDAWCAPALEPLLVPIEDVHPYPGNPRRHDQANITSSLRELGMWAACTVQEGTGHTLVGNGRMTALRELGATRAPVIPYAVDDARAAAVVARDNQTSDSSRNDAADLVALLEGLDDEGRVLAGYADDELDALRRSIAADGYTPPVATPSLADRFLVPPFSVLDARGGAWLERKRQWLALGIESELGRDAALLGGSLPPGGKGLSMVDAMATGGARAKRQRVGAYGAQATTDPATGQLTYEVTTGATSIFDPVVAELAYRWFCPPGGHVLDPFAGGSVRGLVATALGLGYTGVELRDEQVQANGAQAQAIIPKLRGNGTLGWPLWVQGDSREVLPTLEVPPADLLFSCPPYADLEVYSDDPADLSAMPWPEFCAAYRAIIKAAVGRLARDRFAVWVIGEVRDKAGRYRGLVPETIAAFEAAGASFYNEAILVTPVGSLPVRAGKTFLASRKLGKTHQQVLVFCKGDPKAATAACGEVDVTMPEVVDEP